MDGFHLEDVKKEFLKPVIRIESAQISKQKTQLNKQ